MEINFDNWPAMEFKKKPIPILTNTRINLQIVRIILILKICGFKNSGSIMKLNLFSWALKKEENKNRLYDYVNGKRNYDLRISVFDDKLVKSAKIGISLDYYKIKNSGKLELNKKCEPIIDYIFSNNLFTKDRLYLEKIGKVKISDKKIEEIYEGKK